MDKQVESPVADFDQSMDNIGPLSQGTVQQSMSPPPFNAESSSGFASPLQLLRTDGEKMPLKADYTATMGALIKAKITGLTVDAGKMKQERKIHQSNLSSGTDLSAQPPVDMSANRKLVRHLATVFLAIDPKQVEVQAAVSKGGIVWAGNVNSQAVQYSGTSLKEVVARVASDISGKEDAYFPEDSRERRHWDQLKGSDLGKFGDFILTKEKGGVSNQHAETKIIDSLGHGDIDYIGGTRRPCTTCFAYMALRGVDPAKFNPHHGAYWDANAAMLSFSEWLYPGFQKKWGDDNSTLSELATKVVNELDWAKAGGLITKFMYASESTLKEGARTRHSHDIDTDSESESEEPSAGPALPAVVGLEEVDGEKVAPVSDAKMAKLKPRSDLDGYSGGAAASPVLKKPRLEGDSDPLL